MPEAVNAYVITEDGEKIIIDNSEAEKYVVKEGETLSIEYDNGMTVEK